MGVAEETDRRPPSRRIADELRDLIKSGDLEPGDRLPSERALALQYATARNTAREALMILQGEGLITAAHGRGFFVRSSPRLMRLGTNRYSRRLQEDTGLSPFRAEAIAQGFTPDTECRSVTVVAPPPVVAARLGLDPSEDRVVRRENWYYANGDAVQLGVTYVSTSVAGTSPIATSHQLPAPGLYAIFEELGYPLVRIREEITARMPTPEEVLGLAIPPGVPVIEVTHTSFDAARAPFEVTQFTLRADVSGLDYDIPLED